MELEMKDESKKLNEVINSNNLRDLIKMLDRLGRLNPKFDKKPLIKLLNHPNDKIRSLSVKNLAKLEDITLLEDFVNIIDYEKSSDVRREAVSAIGRMRNPINKKILIKYLNDSDSEVILQAIRGLLIFKDDMK